MGSTLIQLDPSKLVLDKLNLRYTNIDLTPTPHSISGTLRFPAGISTPGAVTGKDFVITLYTLVPVDHSKDPKSIPGGIQIVWPDVEPAPVYGPTVNIQLKGKVENEYLDFHFAINDAPFNIPLFVVTGIRPDHAVPPPMGAYYGMPGSETFTLKKTAPSKSGLVLTATLLPLG